VSLINFVNLIISLENKNIDNKQNRKKKTTIQCKRWTLVNIMEIYLQNIPKTSQWSYLLTKYKLNKNMIIS
jgi:hypothetical protein